MVRPPITVELLLFLSPGRRNPGASSDDMFALTGRGARQDRPAIHKTLFVNRPDFLVWSWAEGMPLDHGTCCT